MTVLASGSRGNSTVIASARTRILVDAGISCRELFKRMAAAGEDPCALDAILITHEHQDHVQGLSVAARKLGIPVYFTEATHRGWLRWMRPQKRMTYAAWLAERQAEAARRRGDLAARISTDDAATGPAAGIPAAILPTPGEDNPFYREQELAACAEEAEELAAEIGVPCSSSLSFAAAGASFTPAVASFTAASASAGVLASLAAAAGDAEEDLDPAGVQCRPRSAADPCALPGVEYFRAGARFSIGDIEITPFTIPHDAADPVGFVLKADGIRVGIATDLGYMPANVTQQLRGCDIIMLESNHDLEMLRDGPYPWSVKQRVLSRVGHLSNAAAADFLEKSYDGQAAFVVLAHLSESNNLPELARVAAEFALRNRMSLLANKLVLAAQHEPTEPICL